MDFRLGDIVKVVDNSGCDRSNLGDICVILTKRATTTNTDILKVKRLCDNEIFEMYDFRFQLYRRRGITSGFKKFIESIEK